ncbi:hypothetical protein [Mesorhizobium sp. f-mel]
MTPKVLDAVSEAWLSRRTWRRPPFVEWQGYALSGRQPEALGGAAHCRPFHISTMK